VKAWLAVWRAATKSRASMFFALFLVVAGMVIVGVVIHLVTSRAYELRMHMGPDRWLELKPASTAGLAPSSSAAMLR
jgi:hypothetical protein